MFHPLSVHRSCSGDIPPTSAVIQVWPARSVSYSSVSGGPRLRRTLKSLLLHAQSVPRIRRPTGGLLDCFTLYPFLSVPGHTYPWTLLLGCPPLKVTLLYLPSLTDSLRWLILSLCLSSPPLRRQQRLCSLMFFDCMDSHRMWCQTEDPSLLLVSGRSSVGS